MVAQHTNVMEYHTFFSGLVSFLSLIFCLFLMGVSQFVVGALRICFKFTVPLKLI